MQIHTQATFMMLEHHPGCSLVGPLRLASPFTVVLCLCGAVSMPRAPSSCWRCMAALWLTSQGCCTAATRPSLAHSRTGRPACRPLVRAHTSCMYTSYKRLCSSLYYLPLLQLHPVPQRIVTVVTSITRSYTTDMVQDFGAIGSCSPAY